MLCLKFFYQFIDFLEHFSSDIEKQPNKYLTPSSIILIRLSMSYGVILYSLYVVIYTTDKVGMGKAYMNHSLTKFL